MHYRSRLVIGSPAVGFAVITATVIALLTGLTSGVIAGASLPPSPVASLLPSPTALIASPIAGVDPGTFTPIGPLITHSRFGETATSLADGHVLILGGTTKAAEVYDPAKGGFVATGAPVHARQWHTATLLTDGNVLVAGGANWPADPINLDKSDTAELYDPATGSFSPTGSMTAARPTATAIRLEDGKVLVIGGELWAHGGTTAELYDPLTGLFSPTGSMTTARLYPAATLLHDGRVLVVGGVPIEGGEGLTTAELYDPATGTWTETGSMAVARQSLLAAGQQIVTMPDGRVLVPGGSLGSYRHPGERPVSLASVEIYDPQTGTFAPGPSMSVGRINPSVTLLSDGRVLVAGGFTSDGAKCNASFCTQPALTSAEVLDSGVTAFMPTGSLHKARAGQHAVLLPDGDVLVVGGDNGRPLHVSAEVYQPTR